MVLAAGAGALANSPSAATPRAFSGNPVAGSQGFGIVVETDASLVGTEAEGPAAIGGDLRIGPGYNVSLQSTGTFIAPGDNAPTSLLVNGAIDFAGSAPNGVLSVLGGGYVKVGDLSNANVLTTDQNGVLVNTQIVPLGSGYNSTPRVEVTVQHPAPSVGPAAGLINFPALFTEYRQRADDMAECANNVILLDPNGAPYPDQDDVPAGSIVQIALSTTETNVLHLTGGQLNNIAELRFLNQPTSDGPLLIVVDTTATGGVFSWNTPNMSALEKTSIGSILWDFPDATDITLASGDTLEGTIFAPRAHLLDVDPSNTEGDIIVHSLEEGTMNSEGEVTASSGEVHYFPFTADIDCEDVSTVTPTSTTPTSQPSTSRPPTSKPPTSTPPTSKPPTSQPPTWKPPTSTPATSKPSTSKPPTSKPPTSRPPTSVSGTPTATHPTKHDSSRPGTHRPGQGHESGTPGAVVPGQSGKPHGELAHGGASDGTAVLALSGVTLLALGGLVTIVARRRRSA